MQFRAKQILSDNKVLQPPSPKYAITAIGKGTAVKDPQIIVPGIKHVTIIGSTRYEKRERLRKKIASPPTANNVKYDAYRSLQDSSKYNGYKYGDTR